VFLTSVFSSPARLSRQFSRATVRLTLFPSTFLPQLGKQNDKESARDMTEYKPASFDKGFREGKGWGDLVRVFPARFGVSRDWKVAQVFLFFPDSSPPAAVKINRQY
jgi:hypothetical protein|tara:strand:- start:422 stop:742 length:321 start_codon:yes stop_codon:yes gene_type:complete